MTPTTRIAVAVVALLMLPPLVAAVMAQAVPVVSISYQKVAVDADGNRTVMETGTHVFAEDGRYRLDRLANGERVTRIRVPATGERIEINHTLRVGVRGPINGSFAVPVLDSPPLATTLRPGMTLYQLRMAERASGAAQSSTPLGTKTAGGVLLQGFRSVQGCFFNWRCDTEVWIHAPADNSKPEVVEKTIRMTGPDGSMVRYETTITASARTTASDATFAPPAGIVMRDRW